MESSYTDKLGKFKRNDLGLISSISYEYDEDGYINWRKLVKPEFLYANKEKTQETDVSKLKDDELIIRLYGLRYLAFLRGYKSIKYHSHQNYTDGGIVLSCEITFLPNFETDGQEVIHTGVAGANELNARDMSRTYLAETCSNRAFARCIREFLRIPIVSDQELSANQEIVYSAKKQGSTPHDILTSHLDKAGTKFDSMRRHFIAKGMFNAGKWRSIEDIPVTTVFEIINLIKKKQEEKNAKKGIKEVADKNEPSETEDSENKAQVNENKLV